MYSLTLRINLENFNIPFFLSFSLIAVAVSQTITKMKDRITGRINANIVFESFKSPPKFAIRHSEERMSPVKKDK